MKWLLLIWYVGGQSALSGPYATKADCESVARSITLMTYDHALSETTGLMHADPVAVYCVEGFHGDDLHAR